VEKKIKMEYRTLPKTKDKISSLGFGAMRLTSKRGKIDTEKAEKELKYAIDHGINLIDTAHMYGNGANEKVIGEILKKTGYRNKVKISTKMNTLKINSYQDMENMLNQELNNLQTDHIDYYLIHNIQNYQTIEKLKKLKLFEFLDKKKEEGKIINAGFSYHGPYEQLPQIIEEYEWTVCMLQFNYLDEHIQAGIKGVQYLAKKDIGIIVMEPLKGGLLAGKMPKKVEKLMEKIDKSNANLALSWVLNHPEITCVLSGMNSLEMIKENIQIANQTKPNSLNKEELETIESIKKILQKSYKINCTTCGYCMPCPKGVNIPECFKKYNEKSLFDFKMYGINQATGQYIFTLMGLTSTPQDANLCTHCNACIKKCPQNLPIPELLNDVNKEFHGKILTTLMPGFRKIFKIINII
jgi:predicted aldo/keto reductase-like oxidoreductase